MAFGAVVGVGIIALAIGSGHRKDQSQSSISDVTTNTTGGVEDSTVFTGNSGSPKGRAVVVDGDTLDIDGKRIRLIGIDAVESSQRCKLDNVEWDCGSDAADALRNWIGDSLVSCKGGEHDRYSRLLAHCSTRADDIGAWMVSNGWAVAYRRYSDEYANLEDTAREERRGIWHSQFEMPWDWRHRRKAQ
ncbi:thermonuclease family protein [Aestuariivirga litoralis]|uniref:Thermonuclease family protein n=1 Tax=Aestuariivirga litoralis TaxID=2650924 RepID=A0A2W2BNU3_9HYPH|nr:thermonuclease family protein [Aestuariivirga litoralis]